MSLPMIDMKATGQNIARIRRERGISIRELQRTFGFSTPQAIYKWQQGMSLPAVDNLVVLATIFSVTVDELLIISK